jgi:hypothetical protein
MLDCVKTRNLMGLIEFTNWEQFKSLLSALVPPRIQIKYRVEADKVRHNFTAFVASACRLLTHEVILPDLNSAVPGLDSLLKHK